MLVNAGKIRRKLQALRKPKQTLLKSNKIVFAPQFLLEITRHTGTGMLNKRTIRQKKINAFPSLPLTSTLYTRDR